MKIIVPPEADGLRADVFLAEYVSEIPTRSAAQKLLENGIVTSEKPQSGFSSGSRGLVPSWGFGGEAPEVLTKSHRVRAGEILYLALPAPVPMEAKAEDIPLNIIYEDSDLLVVDKPRGLVVHPGAGHGAGTLVNALLFHCELSGVGGALRPGIVHRLDRDTSGLMVVAKNDAAHAALAAQLERREMGRTYNAVCIGTVKKDRLRIDLPIGRHPRDRKKMAVLTAPGARAREAVTNVEVLERFGKFTLIAARLETGRTHQIRVHMAHIGHPVLGDIVYGAARTGPGGYDFGGQILHAVNLRFTHPSSGEEMEFYAPWPEYFKQAMQFTQKRTV